MDVAIGQTRRYLYRRAGKELLVDAKILDVKGKQITIEFISLHDDRLHQRVLRTARQRVRLVDQPVPEPGAPLGNRNAVKKGQKRIGLNISLSGKRLGRVCQLLEAKGKGNTSKELRSLVYQAIDEYVGEQ